MKHDAIPDCGNWTFLGDVDETSIVLEKQCFVEVCSSPTTSDCSWVHLGEIKETIEVEEKKTPMNVDNDEGKDDEESQSQAGGKRVSNISSSRLIHHKAPAEPKTAKVTRHENKEMGPLELPSDESDDEKDQKTINASTTKSKRWKFPRNSIHLIRFRQPFGWSIQSRLRCKSSKGEEVWLDAPTATYSPSNGSFSNQDSNDEGNKPALEQQDEVCACRCDEQLYRTHAEMKFTTERIEQIWW
jgi:hypothetical protein